MNQGRALIIGVTGQDGAYLARYLLDKGYEVFGTTRDIGSADLSRLTAVSVCDRVRLYPFSTMDALEFLRLVRKLRPAEIYNLSGQTSVGLSFDQPLVAYDSIATSTMQILEALRLADMDLRYFNAASSECFGNVQRGRTCDESTPFRPVSPYGVAKATTYWACRNYREAYGIYAVSGILFNHESPLRPPRFVTRSIVRGAVQISRGKTRTLTLGNLDIHRDWGYAPEYVEAMWRMLQQDRPQDYVIASGETRSLRDFVAAAFGEVGLDWRDHVVQDPGRLRALDIVYNAANPRQAWEKLGWRARTTMPALVKIMVEAEREGVSR